MKKNPYDFFINLCKKEFSFLVKMYECKIMPNKTADQEDVIVYKNTTTGVTIRLDPGEGGVLVNLYKLINNKIPSYSLDNGYILEDVIFIQTSDSSIYSKNSGMAITEDTLPIITKKYAALLAQYASDILRGDFKIFPNIKMLVNKRRDEYNNKLGKIGK